MTGSPAGRRLDDRAAATETGVRAAAVPSPLRIRPAGDGDVAQVQAIYAHHVLNGTASFEEEAPDLAEMAARREAIVGRGLPYLVAESDGAILGFAYAGPFRPRAAYRFTLEDSIYVHPDATRRGIGRALLQPLIGEATRLGYRRMIAVIGDSANLGSIALHARAGFAEAGRLTRAGYKFGRWLDVVFMQRGLGEDAPGRC